MTWRIRSLVLIVPVALALGAESVTDLLLQARQLRDQRNLRQAEDMYRQALEAAGTNDLDAAGIQVELGALITKAGRCAEAEPLIQRGAATRRMQFSARSLLVGLDHAHLGLIYLCLGRLDVSHRELQTAYQIQEKFSPDPDLVATSIALGQVKFFLKDFGGAERFWRRALATIDRVPASEPDRGTVLGNLAALQYTRGLDREAEQMATAALALLERNTSNRSQRAETLNILGAIYFARKDLHQAETTLRAALDEAKDGYAAAADSLRHLGWVLIKGKRCPEAIECFHRALEINRRTMGDRHEVFPDRLLEYSFGMRACGQKDEAKRLKAQAEALGGASTSVDHTIDVKALRRQ
jgi:tetratricopeptide (TPR) repeat protein